jgi:hypothetical protein
MQKFLKFALLLGVSSAACFASVAQAAVTISSGATTGIACASGVCTASATTAVLNVTDLTNILAAGNMKVVPGKKAMDIVVAAPLTWVNTTRLTLNAYRAITFTQPTTITGRGALTLTTNIGKTGGTLSFKSKGNVNFWDLHSSLVVNGAAYKLVNDITTLATDVAANTSGHFALAKSYDAKLDGTYKTAPVPLLDGSFEGLGNSISNLKIIDKTQTALDPNWMGEVGLFGVVSATGSIENIAVLNSHVASGDLMNAGLLVGELFGTVTNSRSGGTSTAGNGIFEGSGNNFAPNAGGLVGAMFGTSAIVSNSSSTATVIAGNSAYSGGLVGGAYRGGVISDSSASGNVTSGNNSLGVNEGSLAGGLIGIAYDRSGSTLIDGDHASGTVVAGTGADVAGGLVGGVGGPVTIEFSYATGAVSVGSSTGSSTPGLAGGLLGTDTSVFLTGFYDIVKQSYATGAVSGDVDTLIGGLVGYTGGTVSDSYATGAVSASGSGFAALGGLVGYADSSASINTSYSTGNVQPVAGSWVGGFVGGIIGTLTNDYWDTDMSGITSLSQGAGNVANAASVTGQSSAQLQSGLPTGFSSTIWKERSAINGGLPYLIAIPPG